MADDLIIDFPTGGFLAVDWIEAHCRVPGGARIGQPLVLNGWQLEITLNHYRVKKNAVFLPSEPQFASNFYYRRSIIVGPQKTGKSPIGAALMLLEGLGPSVFVGWAHGGEMFRCEDHGCGCGFEYVYEPGEPMMVPRQQSIIQVFASAESQTHNVYGPMLYMVRTGPLAELAEPREGFIRLPNWGKIEPVTSAALSKLGVPVTAALGDESGVYTAQNKLLPAWQTVRRGLAAMSGRAIELTNPWDPMENSAAQQTFTSSRKDIYRYYRKPPANLSYFNKAERHKIHRFVYADSPWADLETIEAEAAELLETDPTQAQRFYGNQLVQGLGAFMPEKIWLDTQVPRRRVKVGAPVCVGFDGSRSGDWTALRCETRSGYRFTPRYGPDRRPTVWNPAEWPNGQIPRGEVLAAVSEVFATYSVERMYVDPRHWETQADQWAWQYGEAVVVQWPTNQISRMFDALIRFLEDSRARLTVHDDDAQATLHALAARKVAKPGDKFILGKPAESQKIDILMADVLAHEAASDARADGWITTGRMMSFR